jgi:hypothetical protein
MEKSTKLDQLRALREKKFKGASAVRSPKPKKAKIKARGRRQGDAGPSKG